MFGFNIDRRRLLLTGAALFGAAVLPRTAWAAFPAKPVEILVGFTAGGGVDAYARAIAEAMSAHLDGQPAVVVNQAGAGGTLALGHVLDQPADGYTLSATSAGSQLFRMLFGDATYDLQRDFKALGMVGDLTATLFVHGSSPHKTVADWVAAAKAAERPMRWAHSARQTTYHVAGEALIQELGIEARDVPYNGVAEARNALVAQEVDFAVLGTQHLVGFENELRALAVFSDEPDASAPEVPTLREAGITVPSFSTPVILHVTKETPDDVTGRLVQAVRDAANSDTYKNIVTKAGLPAIYRGPEESEEWTARAIKDWTPIIERVKASIRG